MGVKAHFIKIFSIILLLSLFFALPASAITAQELAQKLRNFIDNAIRVGAVLAFLGIVWGGFLYIKSAGNVAQMSQAKKQIFGSFLGLFLLLAGWLGLRIIRVEFTSLNPEDIPQIVESPKPLTQPVGLYLPSVEIPIETLLKGKDEDKSFLFEFTSTTAEIQKTFEEELLPAVNEIKKGVDEIVGLMSQCSCAILSCPGCQGDPCALVRGLMSQKIQENAKRIEAVDKIVNSPELERKIISLVEPIAKLYYALGQIRKCPEYLAYSRDSFPQLKDWFQKNLPELESVVTKVSLFEEPENLRKWSFADFYCPKGGLGSFIPEEREIEKFREEIEKQLEKAKQKPEEQKEFERMKKEMEEMLKKLGPEYEFALSCPLSIPFGESLEKLLKVLVETINKIREMVKLAKEMNAQLVKIESLISECSSERCYPFEICISETDPPVCFCLFCVGTPCPMKEALAHQFWFNDKLYKNFQQNFQELKDLKKEAESWPKDWENIEKEVRKRETPLTPEEIKKLYQKFQNSKEIVSFELTLARMHYCFAQPKEVEAQWSLANCHTALGSLSPDNKILEKEEECKCETVKECQKNFPVLVPYKCKYLFKESVTGEIPDWLLDLWENIRKILKIGEIEECYNFNFFCCRQK